jgi:RNA polymerase sigma factor (sigma-70 family)
MLAGKLMPGPQRKRSLLSQQEILAILDPNPVRAEEKYVELYRKLSRYFEWNRQNDPEDLAQEALKRGFVRFQEGEGVTLENPAGYFFGIARNLLRERFSARRVEELDDELLLPSQPLFRGLDTSEQIVFLKECLSELPRNDFDLLLAYFEGKAEVWARQAGIPSGTVRMRIHRIRKRLEALMGPQKQ